MLFPRVGLSLGHSLQRRVTKHTFLAYIRKVAALNLAKDKNQFASTLPLGAWRM